MKYTWIVHVEDIDYTMVRVQAETAAEAERIVSEDWGLDVLEVQTCGEFADEMLKGWCW